MALNIKHPAAERLARELAKCTGEGLNEAVVTALRERLARERLRKPGPRLSEELRVIGERCAALPVLDSRTPEEVVDHDERGLPR